MARRVFDITAALLGIALVWPMLVLAAIGIWVSDKSPIFFKAERVGRGGEPFVIFKLRTMRQHQSDISALTSVGDKRVFPFGRILRASKIDELPQLLNVLKGEMSVIGPRPEDPSIVEAHYSAEQLETLAVRPGLASPGSLYEYTHLHNEHMDQDPMAQYVAEVLPLKLAIDRVYIERQSLMYDLQICWRVVRTIAQYSLGMRIFPDPPELSSTALPDATKNTPQT